MGSHRELLDLEGVYAELWNGKYTHSYHSTNHTPQDWGKWVRYLMQLLTCR
jgi:hypothetical protein